MEQFAYWISERENIRKRKERKKLPLTKDPILHKYRFCNVHREDDRVTLWIAKNWREYYDANVWHAMVVARFLNWPPTLEYCGYPEPWPTEKKFFTNRLHEMEKAGARIFTGAYIVSTNGATGSKVDHVLKLFDRTWNQLHTGIGKIQTCQGVYEALMSVNGIGSFMAAQVVADLKYTAHLDDCVDWMDFVAPGPGSQRGLNRIFGYALGNRWNNRDFTTALMALRRDTATILPMVSELHLQDLQNCLCEFDKYQRVLHQQGKPRSQYYPSTVPLP